MIVLFTSCKKDLERPGTGNPPPVDNTVRHVHFILDSLPGVNAEQQNLNVKLSVLNSQGVAVLTDTVLSIRYNGVCMKRVERGKRSSLPLPQIV